MLCDKSEKKKNLFDIFFSILKFDIINLYIYTYIEIIYIYIFRKEPSSHLVNFEFVICFIFVLYKNELYINAHINKIMYIIIKKKLYRYTTHRSHLKKKNWMNLSILVLFFPSSRK